MDEIVSARKGINPNLPGEERGGAHCARADFIKRIITFKRLDE